VIQIQSNWDGVCICREAVDADTDLGCFGEVAAVQATGTGDSDAMRLHRSLAALRRAVATSALVVHWVTWLQTQRPTIPVTSTLRRALPVSVVPTVFCRLTDHGPKTTRAARLWQGRYLKIRWNYEKRASSISSIF
jgi:hypothetical protein